MATLAGILINGLCPAISCFSFAEVKKQEEGLEKCFQWFEKRCYAPFRMFYIYNQEVTMEIPEKLVEVGEHEGDGYAPVVDYQSWRVAILNFSEQLLPGQLKEMQRHNETDEVFILLRGRCILFVGDGEEKVADIIGINMEPFKLYTVKQATWHTHTLDRDAKVVIVENRLTTYDNSPFIRLNEAQQQQILDLTNARWSKIEDATAP